MIDRLRDMIASRVAPVHREGYRFVAIFAGVTLALFVFGFGWLGQIGVVATVWCAFFFRDPPRVTPLREGLVISPADGRVSSIAEVDSPVETGVEGERRMRVSIFMNVFDVHINRAPVAGRIANVTYNPGRFVNAAFDKASEDNERQGILIEMAGGVNVAMVQIAGFIARRIVRFVKRGDQVGAGERIGMIRFGSRVDVYLPNGHNPLIAVGQRVVAGETVLADLNSKEAMREARAD